MDTYTAFNSVIHNKCLIALNTHLISNQFPPTPHDLRNA